MKKGLLVITLVSLIMLSIRPFSVEAAALSIYYDTDALRTEWQGKILGDYWQYTTTDNATDNDLYVYKFRFDKAYIGQIQFQVRFSGQSTWASGSERVLVAGYESFDWYYREYTINNQNTRINAIKITLINLTPLDDYGGDLASIISYLQSIDATEDDIYNVLQSISSDVNKISNLRQYSIPLESIPWNDFVMNTIGHMPLNSTKVNYFNYPVYFFNSGQQFHRDTDLGNAGNQVIYFIFISSSYIPQATASTLFNDSNLQLFYYNMTDFSKPYFRYTIGYKLNYTNTSVGKFYLTTAVRDCVILFSKVLTIYQSIGDFIFPISTDFALITGLRNQMLNDINIIAQGTQQSNSSASTLESSTSTFSSTASDVYNVEDQVSSGFSSSMQNIPSSFNFQNNFGSSFVVSASWVRDQFNNMTANNPFGSLITFSLILGVALLIIGRLLS